MLSTIFDRILVLEKKEKWRLELGSCLNAYNLLLFCYRYTITKVAFQISG